MKNKGLLICLLPLLMAGLFFAGCKKSGSTGQKYHCPMHPTYVTDRPGDCPICGMRVVPIKSGNMAPAKAAATTEPQTLAKVGQYYCPMDPNVVSNAVGRCPECKMKLLLKTNEVTTAASEHAAHDTNTNVAGRSSLMVSADKQQLIGLRTSKAEVRELAATIRTTGTFEHDETRLAKIAPRFAGWVRELKVSFTGEAVGKGDPLLTVYSPELLSAQNEYLLAYRRLEQLKNGGAEKDAAQRMVDSARRRLALWEVGDEEIREIEKAGQPKDEMLIRSPISGHVTAKTAVAGKSFMAGETLYEIADLTHLWLRAYVYEYELPLVKIGQPVEVNLPYLGNKKIESKVDFIYPHIEQQSRRAEIRVEMHNAHHELRPSMWADVVIKASYGKPLTIPASAIIDTGTRQIAFVKRGAEHIEPREVKVGARTDEHWEVLSGVKEGEEVVTRALFLVDSESQLKAAIEGMGGGEESAHQH